MPAESLYELPPAWAEAIRAGVFSRDVLLVLSIADLLMVHGQLCLAIMHPGNPPRLVARVQGILHQIEDLLEGAGVPVPPGGWRAKVPPPGPAGLDRRAAGHRKG
jgi:hypothetical protein